jgi:hypothetical protein
MMMYGVGGIRSLSEHELQDACGNIVTKAGQRGSKTCASLGMCLTQVSHTRTKDVPLECGVGDRGETQATAARVP